MIKWQDGKKNVKKSHVTDAVISVSVLLLQRCAVEGTTDGTEKKMTTSKRLNLTLWFQ